MNPSNVNMVKKQGGPPLLMIAAGITAAAGGIYYYKNKQSNPYTPSSMNTQGSEHVMQKKGDTKELKDAAKKEAKENYEGNPKGDTKDSKEVSQKASKI